MQREACYLVIRVLYSTGAVSYQWCHAPCWRDLGRSTDNGSELHLRGLFSHGQAMETTSSLLLTLL